MDIADQRIDWASVMSQDLIPGLNRQPSPYRPPAAYTRHLRNFYKEARIGSGSRA